jgi:hypothetical protein
MEQPAASAGPTLRTTWLIGKFHGREGGHRDPRVLDDHLAQFRLAARGHQAAVHALAFVGEPLDQVGGGQRLALGFHQRLALLLRDQRSDLAGALADQRSGLAHDLARSAAGMSRQVSKALLARRPGHGRGRPCRPARRGRFPCRWRG